MKVCEICHKEIPEGLETCHSCAKMLLDDSSEMPLHAAVLKKFRGFATRDGKKFSGVFDALDEEDARKKLLESGFEFIKVEPIVQGEETETLPHSPRIRLFLKRCFSQPVMVIVPVVFIFVGILIYQSTLVALRDQMVASFEAARRTSYPQVGDQIILMPGYFLTENKRIFNTALTYQRSGNTEALKALFSGERRMMVTREGMKFIYEGRDGVVPKAAKVRYVDSEEILYVDHDAIDIHRSKEEAAQREAATSAGSKAVPSDASPAAMK